MYLKMVDNMIKKIGFEDERTIAFCGIVELLVEHEDFREGTEEIVTNLYNCLMKGEK